MTGNGLDPDTLLAQAAEATGLSDFGPSDFREGLDVFVASLREEARLSELGEAAMQGSIVSALSNRLGVVDWLRRHPEVHEERIDSPVFVIGMFRAGTTLLSNLLDQDPANRSLLRWEAGDSVPPSSPSDHRRGPRVEAARQAAAMLDDLNPAVRAIHHEDADGPTECIAVMSQDFKSLSWEAVSNVPSYGRWLWSVDQRSAYEYHRDVLRILQSNGVTGRWALKSPHHAIALDALTAVYPDARLVLLHRDPVVLCASVCSLISTLSATFTDADHSAYIAEHWTAMLEESVRRVDDFRRDHPAQPIVDVQYNDLVRDPVATVASLYEALDRPFDEATRRAIRHYLDANPKGVRGRHGYDLESFGLEAEELAERFAGYVDRHDVPRETVGG